jgi:hypothetical protein
VFFGQVFLIIEALPRLNLKGIQFFNIDGAGTGPVLILLHLHTVLLLHLHEGRPHPLVFGPLRPLRPLLCVLFVIAV